MSGSFLFDTNVLLYILHGDLARNYIQVNFKNSKLYSSVITNIELLSFPSLSAVQEIGINELLNLFYVLPVMDEIIKATILIRSNTHLKIPDAIIAASALVVGAILVTNDSKLLKLNWPGLEINPIR
jgi:predicted nucleic acid-binding protein